MVDAIAVTGGIAEGKSTVLGYLQEAGLVTTSADAVASEVRQSEAVRAFLVSSGVEPAEKDAIRNRLGTDEQFRRALNHLMHPLIMQRLVDSGAQAIEVPLLFEACIHYQFREVWVVTCGREEQLHRLVNRLGSVERAEQLLALQIPTRTKCAFAHRVIRTNQPELSVMRYVVECVIRDKP
ncbi:MAG TPA: dephospho-CoA kinase [Fimbriimonadaceae bacterium]|nr:dephospho-CoA kinase [Fimbriimonadaceae bacterium]